MIFADNVYVGSDLIVGGGLATGLTTLGGAVAWVFSKWKDVKVEARRHELLVLDREEKFREKARQHELDVASRLDQVLGRYELIQRQEREACASERREMNAAAAAERREIVDKFSANMEADRVIRHEMMNRVQAAISNIIVPKGYKVDDGGG